MLKLIKQRLVWGLVLMTAVGGWLSNSQTAQAASSKADEVKAAYVMDAKTGQVVYAQNADQQLPIASLSKLMTLYLVERAIERGQIKWTDTVPIQKNVRKMATSATLSVMPMPAKENFTVKELFAATLVGSSNSGAIALGEYVAGSNAKFIKLMNQQAAHWHLDASFISASGLDNTDLTNYNLKLKGTSEQGQNLVSARAVTIIAQHLINDYPEVIDVANQRSVKIHKYTVPTSVEILKGEKSYDPRVPVDGLKTGYTNQAGACLVATYQQNGRRMIATTLGGAWQFTANNNLRLMLKTTERYQSVVPKEINYQIPGTTTKVRLVTKRNTTMWANSKQPLAQTKIALWPLHRTEPNYVAANTAVLKVRLTDPLSGTTQEVVYRTPEALTMLGPLQWATTPAKRTVTTPTGAYAFAK
ncbi:D-alanyl-D-alanine carboxypeptidase [Lactiplantibacillus paraplantarum]|uniref:D-alanyl-D-alanine carboxypeptidase family protein n=1 Tax=Lactiplantibacillus paraplantarum TaxID=60520 RepID=UPI000E091A66|nr:serine hydrolase [Lactiplantibacillus paraplantarum]MCW1909831.1 D-alanyl-D-alanine carboxypeptidase [Lactiplantibacillus paraplantarum]RDG09687.1 D-alanyl-D-alanine carboxypeptidase [Lactiplantibacillus paraplantarum]